MNTAVRIVCSVIVAIASTSQAQAAGVTGQGSWETSLQSRDINNDGFVDAFYDTALNITWLKNANAAAGSAYDDGASAADGRMTWASANAWADNLSFGGYSDWRLPSVGPVNGSTFQYDYVYNGTADMGYAGAGTGWGTASEMGHLFYVALANDGFCLPVARNSCYASSTPGLRNSGDFEGFENDFYWGQMSTYPGGDHPWVFRFNYGAQFVQLENPNGAGPSEYFALAVRDGDVSVTSAVPEPESMLLIMAGLGVVGISVRRRLPAHGF